MKDLNKAQLADVAGGDVRLGSTYQYTGDPADRDLSDLSLEELMQVEVAP
ncbi:MAG: hypothetical protein Q7U16_13555 [Agitococcus sp.]|nr:hypothetical protein [Agitococcus sp.]